MSYLDRRKAPNTVQLRRKWDGKRRERSHGGMKGDGGDGVREAGAEPWPLQDWEFGKRARLGLETSRDGEVSLKAAAFFPGYLLLVFFLN